MNGSCDIIYVISWSIIQQRYNQYGLSVFSAIEVLVDILDAFEYFLALQFAPRTLHHPALYFIIPIQHRLSSIRYWRLREERFG